MKSGRRELLRQDTPSRTGSDDHEVDDIAIGIRAVFRGRARHEAVRSEIAAGCASYHPNGAAKLGRCSRPSSDQPVPPRLPPYEGSASMPMITSDGAVVKNGVASIACMIAICSASEAEAKSHLPWTVARASRSA